MMENKINDFTLDEILLVNKVIKTMMSDESFTRIHNGLMQVRNALSTYYVDRVSEEKQGKTFENV